MSRQPFGCEVSGGCCGGNGELMPLGLRGTTVLLRLRDLK